MGFELPIHNDAEWGGGYIQYWMQVNPVIDAAFGR